MDSYMKTHNYVCTHLGNNSLNIYSSHKHYKSDLKTRT